jgi:hypothetical protein
VVSAIELVFRAAGRLGLFLFPCGEFHEPLGGLDIPGVWGWDPGTSGISERAPLLWGRFRDHLRIHSERVRVDDERCLSHAGTVCKIHRLNGDRRRHSRIALFHSGERKLSSFDHGTFLLGNEGVSSRQHTTHFTLGNHHVGGFNLSTAPNPSLRVAHSSVPCVIGLLRSSHAWCPSIGMDEHGTIWAHTFRLALMVLLGITDFPPQTVPERNSVPEPKGEIAIVRELPQSSHSPDWS